jgi:NADH-quinone oxidoreductase subunit K
MMHPTLHHYLVVAATLFGLGLFTAATRRNPLGMLLGLELVLNAAALNFVAFDHFVTDARAPSGQVFALFIVAFAACEAALALAIVLEVRKTSGSAAADELGH